jgi:hypothetical protein
MRIVNSAEILRETINEKIRLYWILSIVALHPDSSTNVMAPRHSSETFSPLLPNKLYLIGYDRFSLIYQLMRSHLTINKYPEFGDSIPYIGWKPN